jgi:predicted nuclease with TOPRIM domain
LETREKRGVFLMSRLYEITGNLLTLQEMLEDSVDDQCLLDTLEGVQGEYEIKLESYCKVIKNLEADMNALKAEEERLSNKRKTLENNVKRLKKAMFDSMKATGIDKVKGQLFSISIQRNGGKTPVVVDVVTDKLPDNCVKVVKSPDLEALAKLIDAGGCKYAHYGERTESLRIK